MKRNPIFLIAMVMLAVLIAVPIASNAIAATNEAAPLPNLVETVRKEVSKYKDIQLAGKDKYGLLLGCVAGPDGGAMGVHFVNGDLVGDGKIDAKTPEALIYEFRNGRFTLVGVEYVVIAGDWDKNNPAPPVLDGQLFDYNTAPNRYGIPAPFYSLHVWAFRDNPNGMFADWNPRVSCEQYNGENPF